jgi:hypothetical protein
LGNVEHREDSRHYVVVLRIEPWVEWLALDGFAAPRREAASGSVDLCTATLQNLMERRRAEHEETS